MYSTCDELSRPAADIAFTPDHSLVAKDYARAAEASASLLDSWLPQAENGAIRIIELSDADANPYQDGATLFTPLVSATNQTYNCFSCPRKPLHALRLRALGCKTD